MLLPPPAAFSRRWASKVRANGVNNNGQIVGTTASNQAFLYQNGSMLTLNYPTTLSSWALGINSSGMIVGAGTTVGGQTVATYWQGATAYQIGLLGVRIRNSGPWCQ